MQTKERCLVTKDVEHAIHSLISRMNFEVANIQPLTRLISRRLKRGSYQITLKDGRIFKVRCFPSRSESSSVKRLSRCLDPTRYPRVLAMHNEALLMEWMDGFAMSPEEATEEIFEEAGAILGKLHASNCTEEVLNPTLTNISYWRERLIHRLDYLVEQGVLTYEQAEDLDIASRVRTAEHVAVGLTHGDFCLENLVKDDFRKLLVVDMESLSMSAYAYDLARTFYRWKMNADECDAFLAGYQRYRYPRNFLVNFSFWMILILCESATFHKRNSLGTVSKPVGLIEKLLDCRNEDERRQLFGLMSEAVYA